MRREMVQIKVDPETRRKVKILAAKRGIEMGELVRLLVEQEWQQDPSEDG